MTKKSGNSRFCSLALQAFCSYSRNSSPWPFCCRALHWKPRYRMQSAAQSWTQREP